MNKNIEERDVVWLWVDIVFVMGKHIWINLDRFTLIHSDWTVIHLEFSKISSFLCQFPGFHRLVFRTQLWAAFMGIIIGMDISNSKDILLIRQFVVFVVPAVSLS